MDLSIIIVNWNTREDLYNCLFSIKNTSQDLNTEVFVVDNDSIDGSLEMVKSDYPEVHLINSGGNIGFGKANNIAIPKATAPYILFLNPDTILKPKALEVMYSFLIDHPKTGAIACKTIDETGRVAMLPLQMEATPFKRFLLQIFSSQASTKIMEKIFPSHSPQKSGYVRNLYGPCLMVRKDVLNQVGYFDEQFFMYAEDIDLCQRIYRAGWKLYYTSEVLITHLGGKASDAAPKDFSALMMCESISKLMLKNYGVKGLTIYRLSVFISSLIRMAIIVFLQTADRLAGGKNKIRYRKLYHKYLLMLNWCSFLGAKKSVS